MATGGLGPGRKGLFNTGLETGRAGRPVDEQAAHGLLIILEKELMTT